MPDTKRGERSQKYLVQASWTDVPHLDEQTKLSYLASIPDYQRDARIKGIPSLGSGLIYKVHPADIMVADFVIPKHWPKAYGMDFGWNATAVVWGAWNREADVVYLWSAYKRGQAEPSVHADAIKARGAWMQGVCDPAGVGSSVIDGKQAIVEYQKIGVNLHMADNTREAGIFAVWQRLSTGRLRVFESLQEWFYEFAKYQRDERGKIKKVDDHLMDATRYLIMSGLDKMAFEPTPQAVEVYEMPETGTGGFMPNLNWMSG